MHTEPPSQLLADQHHRMDADIKAMLDGSERTSRLEQALAQLRLHLYVEEAILFPVLSKTSAVMAIIAMKREHGEMWSYIESLSAACKSATPVEQMHDDCSKLFQLLLVHNPKEEKIIYTAADKLAAAQPGTELVEALRVAKLPDGWVCEKAPHQTAA